MSYIDGIADAPMDAQQSEDESRAERQMQLDILYRIGCQYNVDKADMAAICQLASIPVNELMSYSGVPA